MDNERKDSETGDRDEAPQAGRKRLGPLQVVASTLAAGLGVQSSRNRERDFKQGKLSTFIIAGLTFTALFIGTVYFVVRMVLESAGR